MAHREFIRTYLIAKQIDIHRIKFFIKTEVYNRKMITIIRGLEIIFCRQFLVISSFHDVINGKASLFS